MSRIARGGLIDRAAPLDFTFDGVAYQGFEGDTLASALLAEDVRLIGRSFKYHRPRGILTAGSEEPNALVTLGQGAHVEPNTRATTVPLTDGLCATSQNRWPSLAFDLMAVTSLVSPLLPAGFYYKTFMWPASFWERVYEPLIRRAAGLGRLSVQPDPDRYSADHAFCDLFIIGGGPAGLASALTAGRLGVRVILADEDTRFGGRLLAERHEINGRIAHEWVATTIAELESLPNVRLLPRTSVFGAYDNGVFGAIEHLIPKGPRQCFWKIVASRSILATGAIERPLVFAGNDIPGVMTASAVQAYVNRWAAAPGKQIAIFTTSDSGWQVAADLAAVGILPVAIIEARERVNVQLPGVPAFLGARVTQAIGRRSLTAIEITDGSDKTRRIAADVLAMAGGWNPSIGLGCNLGAKPEWSDAVGAYLLENSPRGMTLAGAASGRLSLCDALASGVNAAGGTSPPPQTSEDPASSRPLWHVPHARGRAFVDYQNDVTDTDVALAVREGFTSVEHMKRYTTLGMATDQGKTGQVNGNALLAIATGRTMANAGTILSRPPYVPVSIGALAGLHRDGQFRPERRTASHDWSIEQGATFADAGLWKRAQWFARKGEQGWQDTVTREVAGTRNAVGICDVSTLGKIDLHGPDAGTLLDRLYINGFSSLAVGKARYGVMLREDGFVMDDGTTTRFAEDRFFMTTTTVNAAKVMQHIDYARQVLWPELDVQAASVTEHWATYAIAGPHARSLLSKLIPDLDLSNEAFPFMAAAEFRWRRLPARLIRLSFSGELGYELSVPAHHGDQSIRAISEVGRTFDAVAYGTEALGVMRIEKGHAAGNELNGQTTAADLGLGRLMSKKKDFIGRVMAERPGLLDPDRPRLVGLKPISPDDRLRAGAHLVTTGARAVAENDQGYITSAAFSPTLSSPIALALLRRGEQRHGETIVVHDPIRCSTVPAIVCRPVFFDPEGLRVRG